MNVAIVGIGQHRFGRSEGVTGLQQGAHALRNALSDARLEWKDMQFVIGGSRDAGRLDGLVKYFGLSGSPIMNVFNGCATGGAALSQAAGMIESGQYEVGAVVGFDKHERGAFSFNPDDYGLPTWFGPLGFAVTAQFFGLRAQRYLSEHSLSSMALAKVARKAFANGALSPLAWRREVVTEEQVMASPMVCDPLRKMMFCSPSEGGAALIVCSDGYARKHGLQAARLSGVGFSGKKFGSFEIFQTSLPHRVGESATVGAAQSAYANAGVSPKDIDVVQVQDTDSGAEIIHLAELGLCEDGEQEHMLTNRDTDITGRLPVNTDGGCLANGEPIGASALRQICEVVMQLRGTAGARQVPGKPKLGLTHVYGAPGVSVVTIIQS